MNFLKRDDFPIFEVLKEFGQNLEKPRSDKIYSSGNRGVQKSPGARETRNGEFLVPSLLRSKQLLGVWFFMHKNNNSVLA